jgi:hypothetical protein
VMIEILEMMESLGKILLKYFLFEKLMISVSSFLCDK